MIPFCFDWKRCKTGVYYIDNFLSNHKTVLGAIDEILPRDRYRFHDIQSRRHHRQRSGGPHDLPAHEAGGFRPALLHRPLHFMRTLQYGRAEEDPRHFFLRGGAECRKQPMRDDCRCCEVRVRLRHHRRGHRLHGCDRQPDRGGHEALHSV